MLWIICTHTLTDARPAFLYGPYDSPYAAEQALSDCLRNSSHQLDVPVGQLRLEVRSVATLDR